LREGIESGAERGDRERGLREGIERGIEFSPSHKGYGCHTCAERLANAAAFRIDTRHDVA
jgi:hypothetical protein